MMALKPIQLRSPQSGFTLIELVITVAVLAILITTAVPSFQSIILNNRRIATINEFTASINHARIVAITARKPVTICRSNQISANVPTCASGLGWEDGWISFIDANNDGGYSSSETLLSRHEALNAKVALRGQDGVTNKITFNSFGGITQPGKITYCDQRGWGEFSRIILATAGGKIHSVSVGQDDEIMANRLSSCNS